MKNNVDQTRKTVNRILVLPSCLLLMAFLTFSSAVNGQEVSQTLPPDAIQRAVAQNGMVSAAHPAASKIGVEIMKKGGNAIDAAVATAFAISVVEPEMSGLGGGGCMVIWLHDEKKAHFIDYYAAKRAKTYANLKKVKGHTLRSVAIPGTVAGLLYAEEKYGNLSRKEVMQPAIDLAKNGFPMYATLQRFIRENAKKLKRYEGSELFLPGGKPFPIGKIFKQEKLAETLTTISEKGPDAFYKGALTDDLIKALNEGHNPVSRIDFSGYKIRLNKKPLKSSYKDWIVLSAAPPQTGMQIEEDLNILEPFDMKSLGIPTQSPKAFNILTDVLRAGKADARYISDPNWKEVPSKIITSKEYAKKRSADLFKDKVPDRMKKGKIDGLKDVAVHSVDELAKHNTTSLSVVDKDGNAVALTQTISSAFGSGAWVDGYILNNSGYNFSRTSSVITFKPKSEYRIRKSTISPTIILNKDKTVKLIIGAPGAGHIPTSVVSNIVYTLDYDMDPRAAVRMPRIYPYKSSPTVRIETGFSGEVLNSAWKRGYKPKPYVGEAARIYVIKREGNTWVGAADPRHEGGVVGY